MKIERDADVKALALDAGKTDQIFWADHPKGFGVRGRVKAQGESRNFVFQYKLGEKSRRLLLGEWPATKCRAALEKAEALRGQVTDAKLGRGIDPGSERDKIKVESRPVADARKFGALVEEYLAAKGDQIRECKLAYRSQFAGIAATTDLP